MRGQCAVGQDFEVPCYSPITGYRAKHCNPSGKRSIVFNPSQGFTDLKVQLPCGRCIGCRLEYSRQWAVRCMHEAAMYDNNAFITLTYNDDNLPSDHSIHKKEVQKFFKRLRKNTGKKFRYFACGEYGEKNNRPHYHAIIFGYDFPDKRLWSKTKNGDLLFRSQELEKSWNKGHSLIGNVTFESCAYVARYIMKKRKGKPDTVDPRTGKTNEEYYKILDTETGEIYQVEPEFCLMSRRPGLGRDWLDTYVSDTDKDFITIRGVKHKLPKYYDNILEQEDELDMQRRKDKRRKLANERKSDNTYERLEVKRKIKETQTKQLIRGYENYET